MSRLIMSVVNVAMGSEKGMGGSNSLVSNKLHLSLKKILSSPSVFIYHGGQSILRLKKKKQYHSPRAFILPLEGYM